MPGLLTGGAGTFLEKKTEERTFSNKNSGQVFFHLEEKGLNFFLPTKKGGHQFVMVPLDKGSKPFLGEKRRAGTF